MGILIGALALVCCLWVGRSLLRRDAPKINPVGERVVIIGASTGIGAELAKTYAQRGARVLLVARREPLLKTVAGECLYAPGSLCVQAEYVVADITVEDDIRRVVAAMREHMQGCDTVVINAGVISVLTFDEICDLDGKDGISGEKANQSESARVMEQIFRTNVFAPILIAKHFRNLLIETRGKFVVVSSVAGSLAAPTRSLYAATKHAVNGFFNSLRMELSPHGVAVCICLPGSVATDLRSSAVDGAANTTKQPRSDEKESKLTPQDCARAIIAAGDRRARVTYMPSKYWYAVLLHHLIPDFIDRKAAKKYGFTMSR